MKSDLIQTKNDKLWDNYYISFQKNSSIPGVKYPNEHLIRFLNQIKKLDILKSNKGNKLRILELGFGTITNMLAMNQLGYKVEGLEVSKDSVHRARIALAKLKIKNEIMVDSYDGGSVIPKKNNSYDIVVGLQCVYYNIDQSKFIYECNRLLKKNGMIFFSYFTHRHGYMKHIEGCPGGPVTFKKGHPNPRLVGLKPFLYKSKKQLINKFNQYFNTIVGREEFDYLLAYQSWYYLTGIKKTSNYNKNFLNDLISIKKYKYKKSILDFKSSDKFKSDNYQIWKSFLDSLGTANINKYPNEHIVRFLSLKNRRNEKKVHEGMYNKEDYFLKVKNQNALELDPISDANLGVLNNLGYSPHYVFLSQKFNKIIKLLFKKKYNNKQLVSKKWISQFIPFSDNYFSTIFAEKTSYYTLDQERYVSEIARVLKPGGEIFLFYLTREHEYLQYCKQLSQNIYQFKNNHPNQKLINSKIYLTTPKKLDKLWSSKFNISIRKQENDNFRFFTSYYIVYGKLK